MQLLKTQNNHRHIVIHTIPLIQLVFLEKLISELLLKIQCEIVKTQLCSRLLRDAKNR